MRQRIDECDAGGGIGDMLHDYEEAHFGEGPQEEEPEASTKSFYEMLEAAQKPLHGQTKVSQLDGIGCLMALKSQFGLSRDTFDSMLTIFGSILPEDHILPKTMYQATKILSALKMVEISHSVSIFGIMIAIILWVYMQDFYRCEEGYEARRTSRLTRLATSW